MSSPKPTPEPAPDVATATADTASPAEPGASESTQSKEPNQRPAERRPAAARGRPGSSRQELFSVRVPLETKLLFVSLRANERGRFVKISGSGPPTGRPGVIIPPAYVADVETALGELERAVEAAPSVAAGDEGEGQGGAGAGQKPTAIASGRVAFGARRLFMDALENDRGRYVRVTVVEPRNRRSPGIFFPISGIGKVAEALGEVKAYMEEHGEEETSPISGGSTGGNVSGSGHSDDHSAGAGNGNESSAAVRVANGDEGSIRDSAVEKKTVKGLQTEVTVVGSRRIYVEAGRNRQGGYVRVCDKGGRSASAVTLPFSALDTLIDTLRSVKDAGEPGSDPVVANGSPSSPPSEGASA